MDATHRHTSRPWAQPQCPVACWRDVVGGSASIPLPLFPISSYLLHCICSSFADTTYRAIQPSVSFSSSGGRSFSCPALNHSRNLSSTGNQIAIIPHLLERGCIHSASRKGCSVSCAG